MGDARRRCSAGHVLLGAGLLGVGILGWTTLGHARGEEDWERRAGSAQASGAPKPRLLREGTVLSQVPGRFRTGGQRITFVPASSELPAMTVLENLLLSRISDARSLASGRDWIVSGVVTRYRGQNYLLLSHAVAKSRIEPRRRKGRATKKVSHDTGRLDRS